MYDIYNKKVNAGTIEIRIQGGINAANGISGIFKVSSVQVVPKVRNTQEEPRQDTFSKTKKSTEFSKYLDQAIEKECSAPSIHCETTFYGSDRMLKDFHYQKREYTY